MEVLAGPAGSGKTTTVAELARIWRRAGMGEVIGLATSQVAANVLAAAGITRSYKTARFLGHLTGRREARGAMPVPRGSLLIVDEASMTSLADLAAILAVARRTGSKVIVTGLAEFSSPGLGDRHAPVDFGGERHVAGDVDGLARTDVPDDVPGTVEGVCGGLLAQDPRGRERGGDLAGDVGVGRRGRGDHDDAGVMAAGRVGGPALGNIPGV